MAIIVVGNIQTPESGVGIPRKFKPQGGSGLKCGRIQAGLNAYNPTRSDCFASIVVGNVYA